MSERVEALLGEMTIDEKAAMTSGVDMWHAAGCERLAIRGLKVSDGPNGARGSFWAGTTSACTPCGTALGSTWDVELVHEVGALLGRETRTKGADILLAPTVNLHRSPLAGRNFECWSEDPILTAELAVAYINGVQSEGVGAAVKHLVANDSEFERHTISSEVDDRTLHELSLVPFEAAVTRARAMSVMAAYNRLNGTYCAEHPALMAQLDSWDFDGFMISDWWGVKSTIGTARHGVALEMPGPAVYLGPGLADMVRSGEVTEIEIDDKLRRLLGVMERLGVLDRPEHSPDRSVDRPEDRSLLRRAARDSVVLLRNETTADGSPLLPLDPATVGRIAVIGPHGDVHLVQGGGSAAVNPHHAVTILEGVRTRFGPTADIVSGRGCDAYRNLPPLDHRWAVPTSTDQPRHGFTVEYFRGRNLEGPVVETSHVDVPRLSWLGTPAVGLDGRNFSVRLSANITPPDDADLELSLIVGGQGRVFLDGRQVLDMWDTFEPGDAFFGLGSAEVRTVVPASKTPRRLVAEFACFDGIAAGALLIGGLPVAPADSIERAAQLAADADVAIVAVGLNQDWETEGADRADWALPGRQVELIRAVAASQPKTVVLVQAGSPVDMEWVDNVAAVAQIWYLGQETGDAVADLLSGDHSPSGRLPTTFPMRFTDHPAVGDYPGSDGRVNYREGVFVGYRSYDAREIDPRFAFGHGLSYSSFDLSDLRLTSVQERSGPAAIVEVTLSNVGPVRASEVVQVYVTPTPTDVARPPQELKAFAKFDLEASASTEVRLKLPPRSFQYWDVVTQDWAVAAGTCRIRVGFSSRDIRLDVPFEVRN